MHPHAIAANGEDCLYMQDTSLVAGAGRRAARRAPDGDRGAMSLAGGLVRDEDGIVRCWWGGGDSRVPRLPRRRVGAPGHGRRPAVREACLEGFQAGLSWLTILRKREAFRRAFAGFDFRQVARFGERDVERLLGDAAIVRHRGKIESTIDNARRALELVEEEGSLAAFVWRFEPEPAARRSA